MEYWTKEPPTEEGYFWFRTSENNGVMMKIEYYQDLQSNIPKQLFANPQLPYEWSARPVFSMDSLNGEWLLDK